MARRGLLVIKLKLRLLSVLRTDIFQQPTVEILWVKVIPQEMVCTGLSRMEEAIQTRS